jgi:hypothetical protein
MGDFQVAIRAYQERAWSQDGREGQRVDVPAIEKWAIGGEFCSAEGDSGFA